MSCIVFIRPRHSGRVGVARSLLFSTPRQLVATGLLVALLSIVGTQVVAQSPIALTAVQAQDTPETQTDAIVQKLLGQWQTKDPTTNEEFTFIFAPNNTLFVVLPTPNGSPVALKVAYQVNPTTQPMQLDIQLSPQQTALTIFEFTDEGKLRLDLEGLTPGQPRPTTFQPNAPLFDKTSQATTVSENIQVLDVAALEELNNQMDSTPENEAKTYMYALTQVQQARYEEAGEFADTIEEVSIGLRTETESYRYQIVPQPAETQSVMITATAKNAEIPSYTGAVFVTEVDGEKTTVAQICETEQPSTSPPAMPSPPLAGSSEIQCPAGSRSLQLK